MGQHSCIRRGALVVLLWFFVFPLVGHSASVASFSVTITDVPECSDGVDNDGDTFIDFPADPECTSSADDGEAVVNVQGQGGGGGIPSQISVGSVRLEGYTFAYRPVIVLLNGLYAKTVQTDETGMFMGVIQPVPPGTSLFTVYSTDSLGRRTNLFSFPVTLDGPQALEAGPVLLSPSIASVFTDGHVNVTGSAIPHSKVQLVGHPESIAMAEEDYLLTAPPGVQIVSTEAITPLGVSQESLGLQTPFFDAFSSCPSKGDINGDCAVTIVDFSLVLYWYHHPEEPGYAEIERQNLSGDGIIDLTDFSIMAFYWTGI